MVHGPVGGVSDDDFSSPAVPPSITSVSPPQLPCVLRKCTRGGRPLSEKSQASKYQNFFPRAVCGVFFYTDGNNITIASTK